MIQNLYPHILNPTYELNRKCLFCPALIPDQAHAARKHCPRTINPDGTIRDCKSDRHTNEKFPEREKQRKLIYNLKTISDRIEAMIAKKGNTVRTEELDAYDIILTDCTSFEINEGIVTSHFLKHKIISNTDTQTHLITRL